MKDATHHLVHVQRKILRSVRKESAQKEPTLNNYNESAVLNQEKTSSRRNLEPRMNY